MNLYKKNMLKHVMPMNPSRHHKYLYIDTNGNYVYPEDVAKKAGNKARDLNAQGQANAVNMRKARYESVKAGNSRMAAKLKGIYDQGQANNINARKARAESINAGNERVTNSKAYKVGKIILEESTSGRKIKRFNKHANDLAGVVDDINIPKGNKVKPKRKTPEEIAREDAELERSISEKMSEFAAHEAEEYYKDQAKKKSEQLPKGWSRDQNGLVYDELGAIALDSNDPNLKKKKKRAKKSAKKLIKTSVAHSDTYRSNVMNSHQRMIYSSQLQHAERRNHKYLYKIGDRYIYPEDISRGIKKKAQKIINGPKTYKKDREFMKEPGNSINGINKEEDQIGSAHTGSFIKKKTPDSGYQWTDRREYEEGVERGIRSGKDYSNQIERENANKEANRKVNKKRKLRDIRARKISKSIESRNRENEQARYFDEEADRKRRKRALQHGLKWRNHKYLYKIGDRYIYPEDVAGKAKNKLSEAGSKVSSGIKKEKAKLRSIDRGSGYVGTNNKINDLPGSVYSNKKDEAKIRRDYANRKQEEYRKWERHEYFDKTDPKRQEEKTKTAKQIAVSSDAKARQAENRLATATKDAENYQKANKVERTAAKAYGRYEDKKIAKEVENNNKKPHEVNVRKKKSPNKISEAYNNAKKGFRDFGNSAKASYEAGKKAGAAVAEAEKRKKKKKPTVKGSKKVTTWDNANVKRW